MSKLPTSLELDRIGIDRLPVPKPIKNWLRRLVDRLEQIHKLQRDRIETLNPQDHIADPSGGTTIDSEARTAINSILDALESQDLLKTS